MASALSLAALMSVVVLAFAQPERRGGPPVRAPPNPRSRGISFRPAANQDLGSDIPPPPPAPPRSPPEIQRRVECRGPFRTLDGSCTSAANSEWGATESPQFAYGKPRDAAQPTKGLPSARLVSNIVSSQSTDVFNSRGLNEMVTFMGQFLDHCFISTPVTAGARLDIPVPPSDPLFANTTKLRFERSVRERNAQGLQRPINALSSAIDLTAVYGPDEKRLLALRTRSAGLLKTSAGNLLPLNTGGLPNAPSASAAFFIAGDRRSNENPMLTALHTLFVREHNRLAKDLRRFFPYWNDELLFQNAKLVNTALYQKIIYEEFIPAMTGRRLRGYRGYRPDVNPTISDVFGAMAFRIGHTMVGNGINRRGPGNAKIPPIPFKEMFFRKNGVLANGIEPFIRGAIFEPSQEVDVLVVNALRNFLFTGIPEEFGIDLMALNLQRSRDHALPLYNDLRQLFGRPRVRSFRQITKNKAVQNKLSSAYGSVDKIEGIIGLFAEDHVRGASMGRTMLKIWQAEFGRLRDGDRLFYLRRAAFPRRLRKRYPGLREVFGRRKVFKRLILRNTNIRRRDLRGSVWRANW